MVELPILQKGAVAAGGYQGYKALLEQILKYFQTGISPNIQRREQSKYSLFMKASNISKAEKWKNCHIGRSLSKRFERCTKTNQNL